jgi:hypothetical protein
MPNELNPAKKRHPVPAVFESLGIPDVRPSDSFKLSYKNGLIEASVHRADGTTQTVTKTVDGGFSQMSQFNPNKMEKQDRNELIKQFYEKGDTQKEISSKFGLSQAAISKIVNS